MPVNKEEIIKIFAANLRAERAKKRFTQEKLAEMADITPEYIARLEAEKYNPTLLVVANLASALSIPIEKLLKND